MPDKVQARTDNVTLVSAFQLDGDGPRGPELDHLRRYHEQHPDSCSGVVLD